MILADLLVTGIGELATLDEGPVPRRDAAMGELGLVRNAAIAVDRGRFAFVGPEASARRQVRLRRGGQRRNVEGAVVLPGFVDPHTHALFAGSRHHELSAKIQGASYAEIAAEGGGLFSTVRATRAATDATLLRETAARLRRMAWGGTTTVEVKSGYGLDPFHELRLLRLIPRLATVTGLRLVPTFLGAHAVPPEFAGNSGGFVRQIVEEMLPTIARERLATSCDVFCEPGFFSVAESERLLRAASALGLPSRLHADEFARSGGARLAARIHAVGADHLLASNRADWRALARAGVTAVVLPVTPFASMFDGRPPGRELVDAGVPVAVGSDLSPNSWVESMLTVLAHAVYGARLTPSEAITGSTVNAAHVLGVSDEAGRVAVGRSADFSVFRVGSVDEVPYRIGAVPELVFRRGKLRSPSEVGP